MLNTLLLAALLSTLPGPYVATEIRVIDGDTFEATVQTWLQTTWRGSVRIAGIDTPELRGKCPAEELAALKALAVVLSLLDGQTVELRAVAPDKFAGRVVADVWLLDGASLAAHLIAEHHAKPYNGRGPKPTWCPKE